MANLDGSMRDAKNAGLTLAQRLAYILQPSVDHLLSEDGPIEWPQPLLGYQLVGIRELVKRPNVLLADDMGLGKTVQAIGALRIMIRQRRVESALVVAPAGLLTQWRKELHRWAPELRISTVRGGLEERAWQWRTPAHIYLTSYETLRSDFSEHPGSPLARVWDVAILDEAQKIKNPEAEVSHVCKRLKRKRQWALTGTPLENKLDDLISILQFVTPNDTNLRSPAGAPEVLRERLNKVQIRRKKKDVLRDLPPKIVSAILLPLDPAQRQSYDRAERDGVIELQSKGEQLKIQNVLELILRLKQICNFCPRTGASSKLNDVQERLSVLTEEGHKALVFSQFTNAESGARAITRRLAQTALVYTGDMSVGDRERTLVRFRTDPDVHALVLSLRAGGQGLNLQEASYVFHFDRWWNPAVESQAEARAHRMGQANQVNVYTYTCENTIEERIEQVLKEKQVLFDEVIDGITTDLSSSLTEEELFGLFGLTPPKHQERPRNRSSFATDYASMGGVQFENHVQRLIERRGWHVQTTPLSRDGGIDLIATRTDNLGIEVTLYVQCKNHVAPVTVETIRELNGAMRQQPGSRGVVACPSGFTADARGFAVDRGIALWDRHTLFELENDAEESA
jgi:SNF2 family DNA or RNA helicase